jgi:uncharacterized protein (TIGR00369 family)
LALSWKNAAPIFPICESGVVMQGLSHEDQFEPEFIEGVRAIFEEKIVFNQILGVKLVDITPTVVTARLPMRPELVGHFAYNRVHGGVISASLDALGGVACLVAKAARHMDQTPAHRLDFFLKIGTIDLRIDYLRQGMGEFFDMRAEVLRIGSRVGTTRMDFVDPAGRMVAAGSGAYIVS